jgi:outer membrane protein assembly factor BamB
MHPGRLPLAGPLLLFTMTVPAGGQEWSRFRGPNGSGVSPATTIPVRWTEKDYNWKVRLPGTGHSSPVLWGERIFLTAGEEDNGRRIVLCLHAGDGRTLWSRIFPGARHGKHPDNSFASATPAVDEQRVYVCWGGPGDFLVAALGHDGKEVWRTDLGPYRAGHGFGASPIVHGDLLVVPGDQDGPSALFGFDCATGKLRWKTPRKSRATYTTPCVFRPEGRPAEVVVTSYEHGFTAIDPKTGRTSWELDVFNKSHMETSIGSPVVAGDLVVGSSGYLGVRQEVVAVRPAPPGSGGKAREVYRLDRTVPLCTTPLVRGNLLFLWADGGIVTCADAGTGEVHWRQRVAGSYYGSPVWVDGRLYAVSREGDVVVLAAAREFKPLARNRLGEGSHSTPAVAGGRMYVRTFSHLISVGGKKPG